MKVTIDNLSLNYKVAGSGKELIFLHGWGGSVDSFKGAFDHYSRYFRTYAIDFPGFGKSDEPDTVWGVEDYSNCLIKFYEMNKIVNPIVVAHSFGGRVVVCSNSKANYEKIVLAGSAGIKPKRDFSYYAKVYSYKFAKKMAKLPVINKFTAGLITKYFNRNASEDYKKASPRMRGILSKVVNEDLRHLLPSIKAPTLLIWGAQDKVTPLESGQLMEQLIPDAGLVVFEESGHFAFSDEHERFLIILDSFFEIDRENNK